VLIFNSSRAKTKQLFRKL